MLLFKVVGLTNEQSFTYPTVYTREQITDDKLSRYIKDNQLIFGPRVPDNEIDVLHLIVCDSETHEIFKENLSPFIYWPVQRTEDYAKEYRKIRGRSVYDFSAVY